MKASPGIVGRLRLVAGLVLFTYLTLHLTNHALGLVSLAAMEAGRTWFLLLWRNPIGTTILYGAFLTHLTLVLVAIWQRRTFRISSGELLRLAFGLSIPLLLIPHIVANRVANALYGLDDPYTKVVFALWNLRPDYGARQAVLVLVAWTHGMLGLHYWLRFRPSYPRAAPWLIAGGVLVPVAYRINHIHLKAPDPRKTAEWYTQAFNFKITSDETRVFGDRFIRCQSEDGGMMLNISGARTGETLGPGDAGAHHGLEHFGFDSENLEADISRLEGLGARLLEGPIQNPNGPRIAFLRAPDDCRVELVERRTIAGGSGGCC